MNALEHSKWFSTYGLITAQRLLDKYKIVLSKPELTQLLKETSCFYHLLFKVPFQLIFNGILLQQTHDYQVYAQKLLIDYLLSGESGKSNEGPGANIREDLEHHRELLLIKNEDFLAFETSHEQFIAESQHILLTQSKRIDDFLKIASKDLALQFAMKEKKLKQLFKRQLLVNKKQRNLDWSKITDYLAEDISEMGKESITQAMRQLDIIIEETEDYINAYLPMVKEKNNEIKQFRKDIYQFILQIKELLNLLPDYQIDPVQNQDNLEGIAFNEDLN